MATAAKVFKATIFLSRYHVCVAWTWYCTLLCIVSRARVIIFNQNGDRCTRCGIVENATFKKRNIVFLARRCTLLRSALSSFYIFSKISNGNRKSGRTSIYINTYAFSMRFSENGQAKNSAERIHGCNVFTAALNELILS